MAQEAAETFQREAQTCGRLTEAAVACRFLGWTSYCQGDFTKAKAHLQEALRLYDPTRDGETKFRYGIDTAFVATAYLAPVTLALGDIEGARKLIDEAVARAVEFAHVPHLMYVYNLKTIMEFDLGQAQAALRTTEIHAEICRRNQIVWSSLALQSAWARARLGDRKIGIVELRRALAASLEENAKVLVPGFLGGLAELEAEEGDFEEALPRIDEALALARETGAHKSDAFLHRLRGDILLKRDPGNPAARGGCSPDRPRRRPTPGRTLLWPARGALARQTLSVHRPPRRSSRRPRARARRLFANARNARNRGGAGAVDGYPCRRACEARINTAMDWLSCYSE